VVADRTLAIDAPGRFAAVTTTGIFGRLTCGAGRRARTEHRVFLATWDDAIAAGYRPCRVCRPTPDDRYERGPDGWRLLDG
jgi:methylphosphotriester-DNA--protein-cysteine methyltransferase